MNCRFCGTIVPPPPCDCPKCGRPVSAADVSREHAQSAVATIVYREEERADSVEIHKPRWFPALLAVAAVLVTAVVLFLSRSKPQQPNDIAVSPAPSGSQTQNVQTGSQSPQTPEIQPKTSAEIPRIPVPTRAVSISPDNDAADEPISTGSSADELTQKAQAAFDRGDWLVPEDDNALKWSREAQKAGKPSASRIEDQVYSGLMKRLADLRANRDHDAALNLVKTMIQAFPDHRSLVTIKDSIAKENSNDSSR